MVGDGEGGDGDGGAQWWWHATGGSSGGAHWCYHAMRAKTLSGMAATVVTTVVFEMIREV